ncbi:hypothetical protein ACF07T_12935 [Streptomyces sp. NPDC015184]
MRKDYGLGRYFTVRDRADTDQGRRGPGRCVGPVPGGSAGARTG